MIFVGGLHDTDSKLEGIQFGYIYKLRETLMQV